MIVTNETGRITPTRRQTKIAIHVFAKVEPIAKHTLSSIDIEVLPGSHRSQEWFVDSPSGSSILERLELSVESPRNERGRNQRKSHCPYLSNFFRTSRIFGKKLLGELSLSTEEREVLNYPTYISRIRVVHYNLRWASSRLSSTWNLNFGVHFIL